MSARLLSLLDAAHDAGFNRSRISDDGVRVGCSQCDALCVNGMACHETGCPNARRPREEDEEDEPEPEEFYCEHGHGGCSTKPRDGGPCSDELNRWPWRLGDEESGTLRDDPGVM